MSRMMKAANLYAPADIRVEQVPVREPEEGEVLIKVKAVGVCGSDISRVMETGTYRFPTIPGHEFSGEIVELGPDVGGFSHGDRVTVIPMMPCKKCDYCRIGEHQLCENYDYLGLTDGYLLYPHDGGYVPSLRLKILRDGVEDYDLLELLERTAAESSDPEHLRAARELLTLDELTGGPRAYCRDPRRYLDHRRQVVGLMETMGSEE